MAAVQYETRTLPRWARWGGIEELDKKHGGKRDYEAGRLTAQAFEHFARQMAQKGSTFTDP